MEAVSPLAYDDPTDDDALIAALQPVIDRHKQLKANRLYQCVMLARDLETCEALLRGEKVPYSRLDAEWAKRLGVW